MAPDWVWALEGCESRELPFLRVDKSQVIPATVQRGASLIYRFAYTACVLGQPGYILGEFRTTVWSAGKELNTRVDEGFPIETARWVVDTEIAVPKDANPGSYSIEASLTATGATIKNRVSFTILP